MKRLFAFTIITLILFSCNQAQTNNNGVKTNLLVETNAIEITVEYDPSTDCQDCPKWMLIDSNYKQWNRDKAERVFIQNKQTATMDELNALYGKQSPLVIKLKGNYKTASLNNHRVFEYTNFNVVEL